MRRKPCCPTANMNAPECSASSAWSLSRRAVPFEERLEDPAAPVPKSAELSAAWLIRWFTRSVRAPPCWAKALDTHLILELVILHLCISGLRPEP